MIRGPKDLKTANLVVRGPRVELAVAAVEQALSGYLGDTVSVAASVLGDDYRIREEVVRRFEAAGWKVKHVDDQREGNFYWFGEA